MSRFACRPFLREALTATGPLAPAIRAHLDGCEFCAARLQASARLVPHLRARPQMPAADVAPSAEDLWERIVARAEQSPLAAALAGPVPNPAADEVWPAALLESDVARRTVGAPAAVGAASWARVRSSILDQVASAHVRRLHRHWWLGLLGTAVAAGIVLVVVQGGAKEPPHIVFRDIASLPRAGSDLPGGPSLPIVDFAVIRNGATR